jgi:hypothetical protein
MSRSHDGNTSASGATRNKADGMSAEPLPSRVYIPSLTRRVVAKVIDFVAVGFTVAGFSSVTHSYLAGLLIGYALACLL